MKIAVAKPKILIESKETYFYTSHRLCFMSCQFTYRQHNAPRRNTDIGIKCQVNTNFIPQVFLPIQPNEERLFQDKSTEKEEKWKGRKEKELQRNHSVAQNQYTQLCFDQGLNFKCYCPHYFLSQNFFQWLLGIYDICQMYRKTKHVIGRSSSISCRHNKAHTSNIIQKPFNKANQALNGNEA